MALELDYVEYGLETAFTVIAMSLLLMVDPGSYSTYIFLIGLPVLFGYTAFISRDHFNKASLASIIALVYIPLGSFVAAVSVVLFLCNNFISVFTASDSFRAHYSSTAIPLILTGLVIGGGVSGFAYLNPGFESQMEEKVINYGTEATMESVRAAGLDEQTSSENTELFVNRTLDAAEVSVTQTYLENADSPEADILRDSFENAKTNLSQELVQTNVDSEQRIEQRSRQMLESLIDGRIILLAVPVSVMVFYALQPVLGLFTAVFGKLFNLAERRILNG